MSRARKWRVARAAMHVAHNNAKDMRLRHLPVLSNARVNSRARARARARARNLRTRKQIEPALTFVNSCDKSA